MSDHRVLIYVVAVDVAAAVALALLAPFAAPAPWVGTFLLATLVGLAAATPVRLPGLGTTVTATDAFVFTALAAYGALPAGLVALAGVAGSALGRERDVRPRHLAFNAGNVTLSTCLAALVYLGAGGVPGAEVGGQVAPLLAAATVYFLSNTGLVSGAIVLDRRRPFLPTWRGSALWSAVSAYGGLTLAAGLLWLLARLGPTGLALGVPPCWLLSAFYRLHRERQRRQQRRIERVEEINQQLEDKVTERTAELRRALAQLEDANANLRRANEGLTTANHAKSEFLARVSHELRTPLNAILGFSDLLRDPGAGALTSQQDEFLADIHTSGEHLLRLINDILDLSKIEAGRMELHRRPTDVERVMREVAAMLRPQAAERRLALELQTADEARAALLDPGMFRQVLLNLGGNAVKFTMPGGTVRMRARAEERDLLLEVADTGIGIAGEDLPRIFDEFYQVDGSYSRTYGGTGLGLALVKNMVAMHGGRIDVESTPGRGSTFRLRFPAARLDTAPPEEAPSGATAAPSSRAATILVVEDHALNLKLARNALRAQGYRVVEARSGEEALRSLAVTAVDLVLLDLRLPGMDGLETTRRIKAEPRLAGLPIVALTAQAAEEDESRARAAGCIGYITKPIRLSEFPRQIAAFLATSSPAGVR